MLFERYSYGVLLEILPLTEALLLNAARAQHVAAVIRPALESQRVVLCDRFTDSTLAYQGYGRGLELTTLRTINKIATGGLEPDLTFVLNAPLSVALDRLSGRSDQLAFFATIAGNARPARVHLKDRSQNADRIERETGAFHERVRQGYLELALGSKQHIILDGTRPADDLAAEALAAVRGRLRLKVR